MKTSFRLVRNLFCNINDSGQAGMTASMLSTGKPEEPFNNRESEDKMKEYVMIPFQVHEDRVEEAKSVINELIVNIREKEPGTLLYTSLQLRNDPTSFIHFMIFADNAAHMDHRSGKHVIKFVKELYSLCPNEPYPIFLENFDSCGIAVDALEGK